MSLKYHHLQVPSHRQEFRDFPEFYITEIAPYLRGMEQERRTTIMNMMILGASAVSFALALVIAGPFGEHNMTIAWIIGVAAFAGIAFLYSRTHEKINEGVLSLIAQKLGYSYQATLARPTYFKPIYDYGLVSRFDDEKWEDELSGVYRGRKFTLCEAHFEKESSDDDKGSDTVFHGQIIAIEYPKKFLGVTIVKRDAGVFNRFQKPGKSFSQVGLASAEFEKAFEAWSTDQVEARDILDPLVLERFQELNRLFKDARLRAAFVGGELLIALETGDKLNVGSMFRQLEKPERIEKILAELDAIFDLIDVAVTQTDARLEGAISVADVRNV